MSQLVNKVWNFAHVLRDDGVSYGDYLEQITYLLFLKMVDEVSKPPYFKTIQMPLLKDVKGQEIPDGDRCDWETLRQKRGAALEAYYGQLLRTLGTEKGMLGQIFTKSQNRIQDPAKLSKIIQMIGEENWMSVGSDVKGDIYEGLLERNAADTKSGAGQYFTPRALIKAMVACVRPKPMRTIHDPACGTGGFFLATHQFITNPEHYTLDKEQKAFLKNQTFSGNEIVAATRRLCLMNLFLHNIGELDGVSQIDAADALIADSGKRYDYVLANPPFGKKSSITITNEKGEQQKQELSYNRQDFWATTSNKQLNFLQHIRTLLKIGGEAAVVLPDNVLFEGGAGETIRKALLQNTDLHTILRLPTGLFYAHGVKANVLFFENKPSAKVAATKTVWVYDYRTNIHHTLKKKPLQLAHLKPFIDCYHPANRRQRTATWSEKNPQGRWRAFTYDEIIARDKTNLDIFWLKDDSLADLENLPTPDVLAAEIVALVEDGLAAFRKVEATVSDSSKLSDT